MKTIFLEPHTSDFVFTPASFFMARKRSLTKYAYLSEVDWAGFAYTGKVTSLPKSLYGGLLNKVFLYLDILMFKKINNLDKIEHISNYPLSDYNVFLFGYKNAETVLKFLVDANFSNRVYLHLSHYHTFDINHELLSKLDVVFCFDNDISDDAYFNNKFPSYNKEVLQIPFSIGNRFFDAPLATSKPLKITAIGTYHRFAHGVLDINHKGYSTLHPLRMDFAACTWPDYVNVMISKYDSNAGLLNKVFKGQRKYFSYDMVDLLSRSSHVFVGKEGTGAVAIGTLEAMACGSIVFMSESEAKSLMFDSSEGDVVTFSDFSDLEMKVNSLDSRDTFSSSEKNRELARSYSKEQLLRIADKVFTSE